MASPSFRTLFNSLFDGLKTAEEIAATMLTIPKTHPALVVSDGKYMDLDLDFTGKVRNSLVKPEAKAGEEIIDSSFLLPMLRYSKTVTHITITAKFGDDTSPESVAELDTLFKNMVLLFNQFGKISDISCFFSAPEKDPLSTLQIASVFHALDFKGWTLETKIGKQPWELMTQHSAIGNALYTRAIGKQVDEFVDLLAAELKEKNDIHEAHEDALSKWSWS
ncbi:hypothetical protein GLAREA_00041 [Glarea lozoyensis ATCC 20868]|uniref:Uncharacterized protein n=1 Tax=Glarea lozoyensis (strain ATCC 20868 / MF5171) TaxID=1116229 RepID=S3DQZ7_GLAL2|nr:uncharacterized protein GLAREA_00041 [Glarea lozoyensis ATCC 20868]EPE28883.1 hypothetical protein GLAREA_00041 [Glarea lozoyensis ATCC 20868]